MKKQTKKQMMIRNKRITNLPRYEFGKIDNPVGYQAGDNYVNTGFVENPTADLNSEIKGQRQLNWINGASQSMLTLNTVYPTLKGTIRKPIDVVGSVPNIETLTDAGAFYAAPSSNITGSMVGINGVDIHTLPIGNTPGTSFLLNVNPSNTTIPVSLTTLPKGGTLENVVPSTAGENNVATTGALNGLSKAASIVGGLVNTAQMGKGIYDSYTSAPTADDVSSWSGTNTNYGIGNVAYKTKTAPNADQVVKLARKRAGGAVVNSTLSGMGAGASFGSLLGPLGMGIGAGVGALVGFIPSIFGWRRSKNKTKDLMNNTVAQYDAYNRMSESVANSQGMINNFKNLHTDTIGSADKGKVEGEAMDKKGTAPNYAPVWNPSGYEYGPVNAKVGFGETIADLDSGMATVVKKGTKGVDNQYSSISDGDRSTVFGNETDPMTGQSFADEVRPTALEVERLNNIKNNKYTDKQTAEVQQREIEKAKQPLVEEMRNIADRLKYVRYKLISNNYNCGKISKYEDGKTPFLYILRPDYDANNIDSDIKVGYRYDGDYGNYLESPVLFNVGNIPVNKGVADWGYASATHPLLYSVSGPTTPTPTPWTTQVYRNLPKPEHKDVDPKTKTPRPKVRVTGNDSLTPYMMSTVPGLIGMANSFANAKRIKNQDIHKYNPFVSNDAINALHKPEIDYSWKPAVRDAYRQALYNNRTLAGGQKLLANSALNTGMMRTNADYMNKSYSDYMSKMQDYDKMVSAIMQDNATRNQAANQYADETYRRAASNKETLAQAYNSSAIQNIFDMFKNYNNNHWSQKNIDLYQQDLNRKQLELVYGLQNKNNIV